MTEVLGEDWLNILVDRTAQVIAGAVDGSTVFASGVTTSVTDATPAVVPFADDFTEAGLPAVTVAATPWSPRTQPGNQRIHQTLTCAVWRPRVPLGDNLASLYGDAVAIADAFVAHGKLGITDLDIEASLMGGPGVVERAAPVGQSERVFLTLPFTVDVVFNRYVSVTPA